LQREKAVWEFIKPFHFSINNYLNIKHISNVKSYR
jgi:hypothetical protein